MLWRGAKWYVRHARSMQAHARRQCSVPRLPAQPATASPADHHHPDQPAAPVALDAAAGQHARVQLAQQAALLARTAVLPQPGSEPAAEGEDAALRAAAVAAALGAINWRAVQAAAAGSAARTAGGPPPSLTVGSWARWGTGPAPHGGRACMWPGTRCSWRLQGGQATGCVCACVRVRVCVVVWWGRGGEMARQEGAGLRGGAAHDTRPAQGGTEPSVGRQAGRRRRRLPAKGARDQFWYWRTARVATSPALMPSAARAMMRSRCSSLSASLGRWLR